MTAEITYHYYLGHWNQSLPCPCGKCSGLQKTCS